MYVYWFRVSVIDRSTRERQSTPTRSVDGHFNHIIQDYSHASVTAGQPAEDRVAATHSVISVRCWVYGLIGDTFSRRTHRLGKLTTLWKNGPTCWEMSGDGREQIFLFCLQWFIRGRAVRLLFSTWFALITPRVVQPLCPVCCFLFAPTHRLLSRRELSSREFPYFSTRGFIKNE